MPAVSPNAVGFLASLTIRKWMIIGPGSCLAITGPAEELVCLREGHTARAAPLVKNLATVESQP